ncbi:dTDP-glucose 4,6-dehydratase [soil metagenome]
MPDTARFENVLVTGGFGFIGAHLVRAVRAAHPDVRIVNLELETYAADPARLADLEGDPHLVHVRGDVADRALVTEVMGDHRIQAVLHLAAESHVDRSIADGAPFLHTNVVGTFTMLEAARRAWAGEGAGKGNGSGAAGHRFVHVSTDEVFGDLGPDDPPFTESSPYAPSSPYSASKAAADHFISAAWRTWGTPVILTHSGNNFGPGQHDEKFLPTVIRSALRGEPVPIYGSGTQVRDWIHVEDHVEALLRVLARGRPGRRYLVGAGHEQENLALARIVLDLLDTLHPEGAPHARLLAFVEDRPGHDRRYALDAKRIREELGWSPRRSFPEALERTVAWYVERHREGLY